MKPTNKPMKRLSLYLFLILFSLQTPSQADDIRDFQIEGMSIGDSLLDYFSEEEINNFNMEKFPKDNFVVLSVESNKFKDYDAMQFNFKPNDNTYLLHGVVGIIAFPSNIKNCYKKMDEIVLEMSDTFKNIAKKGKKDIERDPRYTGDPTGKTIVTRLSFWFDNDDRASISCYDYSEEHGGLNNLTVGVQTKEQNEFLLEKAYK